MRRGRPQALKPIEKFELRLQREAGVTITDCAKYWNIDRSTALRILAELRRKLGPEKLKDERYARSYLGRREIPLQQ
jgi:predicted DNA-binding protein (UPF0251 family)